MFDRLFDFVFSIIDLFKFWEIVAAYEEGIVLRFGKFHRTVAPGFRWMIPFGIEQVLTNNVVPASMSLSEQSLVTADGKRVVITAVLMWKIFDIRRCMLDVEDAEDTLADIAVGYVQEAVEETSWADIRTKAFRTDVKRRIQKNAREWGITVYSVKFKDLTDARTIRLLGGVQA